MKCVSFSSRCSSSSTWQLNVVQQQKQKKFLRSSLEIDGNLGFFMNRGASKILCGVFQLKPLDSSLDLNFIRPVDERCKKSSRDASVCIKVCKNILKMIVQLHSLPFASK